MKKILFIMTLLFLISPNFSMAQTNRSEIDAIRAEIDRLNAELNTLINSKSDIPVIKVYQCLDLPSLYRGMKNEEVNNLQIFLKSQGASIWNQSISATGYFGSITQSSIANFQLANGIIASHLSLGAGRFGPKTRAMVKQITCTPPVVELGPQINIGTSTESTTQVATQTPIRSNGLYVSFIPQTNTNVAYEAGDLAQILTLRFAAVGMDLDLKRIGLDFTKGDVLGIESLNVQSFSESAGAQTIIGSVNVNSKEFLVNLERGFIIPKGEYRDLNFVVKVSNMTRLSDDFFSLNLDTINPKNTYATNVDTGENVYVTSPQLFENQGAWLLDDKQGANMTITSPVIAQSYDPGDTVKIAWYSSGLVSDEKVKIEILDKNGVLGQPVLPSFLVSNTGSYDFIVPSGFTTMTGTFAIKASCTIHECDSTSINLNIK